MYHSTQTSPFGTVTKCVNDYWQDPGIVRYFQQQCGLTLCGGTFKHLIYFYGTGNNGKTMLFEIMTGLLGSYATSVPIDSLLKKNFSGVPTDLAKLRGARLVTTSELPEGQRLNEALVKQITGGGTITARFMRQDFFDFVPQFKLWFDGNCKPALSTDQAVWDRFHYLPFTKTFARDDSLRGKLRTELPGILQWCYRGWCDYTENGLVFPDSLKKEKETFRSESDEFGQYLETFFTKAQGAYISRKESYTVFLNWWQANHPGYGYIPDAKRFASEMRRLIGEENDKKLHGGLRCWVGLQPNAAFQLALKNNDVPIAG